MRQIRGRQLVYSAHEKISLRVRGDEMSQTNKMSLRVTIHAGPRTKIRVSADAHSVNQKYFKLANGVIVTSTAIEAFVKESIETALKEMASEVTT